MDLLIFLDNDIVALSHGLDGVEDLGRCLCDESHDQGVLMLDQAALLLISLFVASHASCL